MRKKTKKNNENSKELNIFKGVSGDWWNYRHFQHHAKPNTIRKDPDIRFGSLLVLGKILPREVDLN